MKEFFKEFLKNNDTLNRDILLYSLFHSSRTSPSTFITVLQIPRTFSQFVCNLVILHVDVLDTYFPLSPCFQALDCFLILA